MINHSPQATYLALTLCLLTAGCQSAAPKTDTAGTNLPSRPVAPTGQPASDISGITDPCAERMHDLCEAMLLYYITNKHLPATLPELRQYADVGVELNFSCPVSGDAYVYAPAGLSGSGIHDLLVLYDLRPAHHGHRWGIVMTPAQNNKPVTLFVIPLKDALLAAYLQGSHP